MASTTTDLVFNELGPDGLRRLKTIPAKTPVFEVSPKTNDPEIKECFAVVDRKKRAGEFDFAVRIVAGRPRVLHMTQFR